MDNALPKVQLKKLYISKQLSEETIAFTADVWVNGKKTAYAKNDGHGGETMVSPYGGASRENLDALHAFGKAKMPAEYKHIGALPYGIDELVREAMQAKEDARYAKSIARMDAKYKARAAEMNIRAVRFEIATGDSTKETRWWEFRKHEDEAAVRAEAERKFPGLTNWTVIA